MADQPGGRRRKPTAELRRSLIWSYGTEAEVDAVCIAARRRGLSVSAFVREAVLAALETHSAALNPHYTKDHVA